MIAIERPKLMRLQTHWLLKFSFRLKRTLKYKKKRNRFPYAINTRRVACYAQYEYIPIFKKPTVYWFGGVGAWHSRGVGERLLNTCAVLRSLYMSLKNVNVRVCSECFKSCFHTRHTRFRTKIWCFFFLITSIGPLLEIWTILNIHITVR